MFANRPEDAKGYFEKALEAEQDPKWKVRITAWMRGLDPGAASENLRGGRDQDNSTDQETERAVQEAPVEGATRPLRHLKKPFAGLKSARTSLSGSWQGAYMGSKLRMQFQQTGRNISGILQVQSPSGHENVYNFIGTFDHGKVVASHQSGSNFRGSLTDERRLVGILTTAEGVKIPVDFSENQ